MINEIFIVFQRFYCNDQGENVPVVHRSQLAASLKASLQAFSDRRWLPYELPEHLQEQYQHYTQQKQQLNDQLHQGEQKQQEQCRPSTSKTETNRYNDTLFK